MTTTVPENFFTKYFLTLIVAGNLLISSVSMTNYFEQNVLIHFFLTVMLTFAILFIEVLANGKLSLRDKAIKMTPIVILNALLIFFICVAFIYI